MQCYIVSSVFAIHYSVLTIVLKHMKDRVYYSLSIGKGAEVEEKTPNLLTIISLLLWTKTQNMYLREDAQTRTEFSWVPDLTLGICLVLCSIVESYRLNWFQA